MFFVPLPMKKSLETLEQAEASKTSLPDPELYIIVNGQPTKSKIVWRSLVDVKKVRKAVQKLKEINWLYVDVHDNAIEDSTRQVIEVVNSATSTHA